MSVPVVALPADNTNVSFPSRRLARPTARARRRGAGEIAEEREHAIEVHGRRRGVNPALERRQRAEGPGHLDRRVVRGQRNAPQLNTASLRHELDVTAQHAVAVRHFHRVQHDLVDRHDLDGRTGARAIRAAQRQRRQRQLHRRAVYADVRVLDAPGEQGAQIGAETHVAKLDRRWLADRHVLQLHRHAWINRRRRGRQS